MITQHTNLYVVPRYMNVRGTWVKREFSVLVNYKFEREADNTSL